MLYTSGSTGHPKGAISCHRNVLNALLSWELDMQAALGNGLVNLPTQDRQAATLLGVPLFHVTGSHAVFLSSYRAQRRCVSMYKWDVAEAVRLIETEQITQFVAPAAMTGDLADYAVENDCNISSLQVVGGGGAPRAPEQVARIKSDIDSRPNTGWGMTETNAIGTAIIGEDYLERPASSGRVSAVLDIRIVDENGHVLPAGERGELQICGGSIIRGYWNRPDANAETFDGDWLRTGDVAYLDEDGFVFIVDRIKDLVIRGGENIGCGAVEAALLEYPDIVEASVYGVPDDRLGEEVGATIFAKMRLTARRWTGFYARVWRILKCRAICRLRPNPCRARHRARFSNANCAPPRLIGSVHDTPAIGALFVIPFGALTGLFGLAEAAGLSSLPAICSRKDGAASGVSSRAAIVLLSSSISASDGGRRVKAAKSFCRCRMNL